MLSKINELPTYDGGDTGFLNVYFPDWYKSGVRLPYTFNCQRILQIFTQKRTDGYWNEVERKGIKIIHYSSSPKPWTQTICPADQIWKQYFMELAMNE
jgi:glycogenin glucosyltransferase